MPQHSRGCEERLKNQLLQNQKTSTPEEGGWGKLTAFTVQIPTLGAYLTERVNITYTYMDKFSI